MDAMPLHRNVLILRGSVPWSYILGLLDQLLAEVVAINGLEYTPQPWQIFSFICASGDKSPLAVLLSRGQKSTDECRQIMELIHRNSRFLALVPSSYGAYSGAQSMFNALSKHLCEPPPGRRRCELFVWNSHKGDEATHHITSYSYDPTRTDAKDSSVSELFFQALRAREYPDDGQEVIDYPFPGLVNSALTSDEFHDNQICISLRVPARDDRETDSELDVLGNTGFTSHFPFIFAPSDNELKIEGDTRPDTASIARETMLKKAAEQLAMQFDRSPNKMSGTKNTTVVEPADVANPI